MGLVGAAGLNGVKGGSDKELQGSRYREFVSGIKEGIRSRVYMVVVLGKRTVFT